MCLFQIGMPHTNQDLSVVPHIICLIPLALPILERLRHQAISSAQPRRYFLGRKPLGLYGEFNTTFWGDQVRLSRLIFIQPCTRPVLTQSHLMEVEESDESTNVRLPQRYYWSCHIPHFLGALGDKRWVQPCQVSIASREGPLRSGGEHKRHKRQLTRGKPRAGWSYGIKAFSVLLSFWLDVAQGCKKGAPSENRTHSWRCANLAC